MGEASKEYNALPIDQRMLLRNLMMENELRLIAMEQKRITADYRMDVSPMEAMTEALRAALSAQ